MSNLFIGVMSGTSFDGIDIALCQIDSTSCKLIASEEYPFPTRLKEEILAMIEGVTSLKQVGEIDNKLGHLFADKLTQFLHAYKLKAHDINAIGLHGQTLWHAPDGEYPFTMQLGDANIVAAQTLIQTVADFRRMDIANGGQGAPFAPAFHEFLFSSLGESVAVVNIGGMANISLLGKNLRGWDSGCGNVLLDMWIGKTLGESYDKDGTFAKSGKVQEDLLQAMINDEYFKKLPPKSTGREYFNQTWLAKFLPIFNTIKEEDIQRTLLELTALSIAKDINAEKISKLIVCGGGSKNGFLMQRLGELCSCEVLLSDTLGVDSDFLEAMAFAWFAYKRLNKETVKLSHVTGAKIDSLLGAIYG